MGPHYSLRHDPILAKQRLDRTILTTEPLGQAFTPPGGLHSFDLRPELASITAPTLILAGQHDWICPPRFSEEIHALISTSDLRIFEESSHSILADETQNCLDAIAGFVVYRSLSSRQPDL
jgi:proline iminopeptidase